MIPDLYPPARAKMDGTGPGTWSQRGKWKIVIHTTETLGLPGYEDGQFAPHVTYWPKHRTWTQHFKFSRPAEAIKGFDDDKVIQMETVCYSDKGIADGNGGLWVAKLSDQHLDDIAAFLRWVMGHLDIPAKWPERQAFSSGEAKAPGFRFTEAGFLDFGGLLGHQHTPAPNDHWDPGALPWERLLARLEKEDDDMFSRVLNKETWGTLFDQGIVQGRSKQVVVNYWSSPERTDEEHRHATNVILRIIAGRVDEPLRNEDTD
jgi:hypothetical protein